MNIKALITNDKSRDFITYIKKVIGINYYSRSYSNLMGFTIRENYLQFKNYYELKEIPTDELLSEYLPEIETFKMVSQFWDKNVKSSLALGLKFDDKNETRYFHIKFGSFSRFVIQPKPSFIKILEYKIPNSGISYEYTNGVVLKKHYTYIENKNDIAKVLALNKLKIDPLELEHLECYYTDSDFKVNLIYNKSRIVKPNLGELNKDTEKTYKEVVEFLENHKKPILYVGITKSKKLSLYFTATNDKDFIENL
jgi:hypothetical protein